MYHFIFILVIAAYRIIAVYSGFEKDIINLLIP